MRYAFVLMALALAGCGHEGSVYAREAAGKYQSVRIDTPGVEGAACALQTSAGSYVVISPAVVSVTRNAQPMSVSCTKGEHFRGFTTVPARRVADAVYAYPDNVTVPMGMNTDSLKVNVKVF